MARSAIVTDGGTRNRSDVEMGNWLKIRLRQLKQTFSRWRHDDGSLMAASMAYYATFSFFPMLLFLTAVLGFVLQFSSGAQNAEQELLKMLSQGTSPVLAENVQAALSGIRTRAVIGGPLGFAALFLAAVVMFTHLETILDRVWNTPRQRKGIIDAMRHTLLHRLRAFLMLLTVGLLVFAAFIASMVTMAIQSLTTNLPGGPWLWSVLQVVLSVGLNWMLFTVIYKVLPKVKVHWGEASRGGNLAAVLWEISRQLLALYYTMGKNFSAYGVVGSVIVLMLWIYIACGVLILGAQYVKVIRDDRVARERRQVL
jgi:membrane protein